MFFLDLAKCEEFMQPFTLFSRYACTLNLMDLAVNYLGDSLHHLPMKIKCPSLKTDIHFGEI